MKLLSAKAFHRRMQLVTALVFLVNGAFFVTGILTAGQAVLLFLAVEAPLALFVLLGFVTAYVECRRRGLGAAVAVSEVLGDSPFWRPIRAELLAYQSLWFWGCGRDQGVEPGGVPIRASGGSLVLPVAFGIATVVEIAVLHLLIPWMWLSAILAVVSVWSLLALFGYLAVHRVHPHFVTDSRFVVRQSGKVVVSIDRTLIASARCSRRYGDTAPALEGGRLVLPNLDGTNIDVVLKQPIPAGLPSIIPRYRRSGSVDRVSLYIDEPADLVTALSNVVNVEK